MIRGRVSKLNDFETTLFMDGPSASSPGLFLCEVKPAIEDMKYGVSRFVNCNMI